MKKSFYAALSALLLAGCTSHNGYVLTGQVPEGWEGKPVTLFTTDAGKPQAVDSTTVLDGKFRFRGQFETPRQCQVVVFLNPEQRNDPNTTVSFPVFLDNTAVNTVCDISGSRPSFATTGGSTQIQLEEYRKAIEPLSSARKAAFDQYRQAFYHDLDLQKGVALARETTEKGKQETDFQIGYICEHTQAAVSLSVLQKLCEYRADMSSEQLDSLFTKLSPALKDSEAGRYTQQCIRDKKMLTGGPLPEIEVQDMDGNVRKISDFIRPGHPTLIEIWASWCSPCRSDLPFVKQAYEKYRKQGFDVVSISIDKSREDWLRAVTEEKMPWPQVIDSERQCFEAYNTSSVPTTIMLDSKGLIYSFDARGGWLFAALEDIYGNQ